MALSDMKVFNDYLQGTTAETVAQMVDKFNAASGGAIVLTSQGIEGDYKYESFWASIHAAQRRVDRYNTNGTPSSTSLSQLQSVGVKVAGGFGPILWEPGQISWIKKSPQEALEVISRNLAEAIVKDQLNTAIACAVAAIEPQTTATYDTGTGPITYADINLAHAKFGDSSSLIVCDVMAASLRVPRSLRAAASSSEASSTLPAAVLCSGISLPKLTRIATGPSACTACK